MPPAKRPRIDSEPAQLAAGTSSDHVAHSVISQGNVVVPVAKDQLNGATENNVKLVATTSNLDQEGRDQVSELRNAANHQQVNIIQAASSAKEEEKPAVAGEKTVWPEAKPQAQGVVKPQAQAQPTPQGVKIDPKHKKRKIAMFLAYLGAGFQGMQKNPGAKTIEGELEKVLYKVGAIHEGNFDQPRKIDWVRAARTDKGVSAVGNVVSAKIVVDPPGFLERVNEQLPSRIRLLGFKRVTNSFDAKNLCDRRMYEYILPTFALDPAAHRERQYYFKSVSAAALEAGGDRARGGGAVGEDKKVTLERLKGTPPTASAANGAPAMAADGAGGSASAAASAAGGAGAGAGGTGAACESGEASRVAMGEVAGSSTVAVQSRSDSIEGEHAEGSTEAQAEEGGRGHSETPLPAQAADGKMEQDAGVGASPGGGGGGSSGRGGGEEQGQVAEGGPGSAAGTSGSGGGGGGEEAEEGAPRPFAFTHEVRARLNRLLGKYVGTRNYHNFTQKLRPEDPAAKRYIVSFEAGEPFVMEGVEFVRCCVVGQSFVLHQIRKMIGLAVAVMRGCAPESLYDFALSPKHKVNVPLAPEVGLFLAECIYASYNRKFSDSHEEMSLDAFRGDAEQFKHKWVYPHIAREEKEEHTVALWLHSLNERNFPEFAQAWKEEKGEAPRTALG
eukprot:jgi/Mesen1/8956/ME000056S08358